MELLILGSVLMFGALFAASGLFDGSDDNSNDDDEPNSDPDEPPFFHGGAGDDTLSASDGTVSAWRGDDSLDLTGDAHGYGNQGDDTIAAGDDAQAHGGQGNDFLDAYGSATVWGDDGDDRISTSDYQTDADALTTAYGGDGNDQISADVGHAYGGAGNDHMTGIGFEDYPVYDGFGTTLHGNDGDDMMIGLYDAQVHGDAGNDTIALTYGGDGAGGAGDDTLIISPVYFGASADSGTIFASGGEGRDVFAFDMEVVPTYASSAPTVITDFNSDEDRLLVEVTGDHSADYVFDHASALEDTVSGYTDVTLHWRALDAGLPELTSLVRLEGVQDFDPESIELVSTVETTFHGGSALPSIGDVLQAETGGDAADAFANQTDSYVTTGAGDDTVTTSTDGEVVAELGAGDDSLVAHGAAHVVFGGAGDDSYLLDAPQGIHDSTMHSGFNGGDGNDSILIRDDGDTADLAHDAGPGFDGGAGNDNLEAQAGTGHLTLDGGSGNDVLIGQAGQSFNTESYGDNGTDDITVNLTAQDVAANGAATVRLLGSDHLTLNIDPSLTGEISFHYNTAGNGIEVLSTEIRVGGVTVAIVAEGIPLIEDAIALGDTQLAINRAPDVSGLG